MNAARAKQLASETQREINRIAHEATALPSARHVTDINDIRGAVADFKKAATSTQSLGGDGFRVFLRSLSRTAPDAIETISRVVGDAIKHMEVNRTAAGNAGYSQAFHRALSVLGDHGISLDLAGRALQSWHMFCAESEPPEPIVEVTSDGGVRFAWSTERVYLDAEIYSDGSVEWFYEDLTTGKADGTVDERDPGFPGSFFEYMRTLRESG